jgi:sugar phosphate isomerase/epimerase
MKTRTAWLFLLLAIPALCLLGVAANVAGPATGTSPPNPFFAFDNGVGRDLKWSPAQQAAALQALGYDGIGYTGTEDFAERQRAFRDQGLKIFSLYVACYVDQPEPYAAQLKAAIQQLKGTDAIVWLTVQGQAANDTNAVRVVREIAELAGASGVRVALYPHRGFFVATAEDALRLVRQVGLPNLGVSLNLCHELAAGNASRMEAIAKACGPQLFLVAINGADPSGGWNELIRPLGEGRYDVAGFVRSLRNLGYAGPIGLQCYNLKGDPKENLRRSIAAWREMSRPDPPAKH